MSRIKLGVSQCLCGDAVRFDGAASRNAFLMDGLSRYFDLVPYCPEMAIGLGVPRPALRLRHDEKAVRLTVSRSPEHDLTAPMIKRSDDYLDSLSGISGYILKSASPSCGMERVRVYDVNDVPTKVGTGIFAARLMERYPDLPAEEDGRLNDPVLRENFIQRVYVYSRWVDLIKSGLDAHGLMEFHKRHKFILLAHDESIYRSLGPKVAAVSADDLETFTVRYIHELMTALRKRATRKRHTNVLMHVFGFLKKRLQPNVKHQVLETLDNYRCGLVPLIVPITMIRHYLQQYPHDYILSQYYLEPYPDELMLRNTL